MRQRPITPPSRTTHRVIGPSPPATCTAARRELSTGQQNLSAVLEKSRLRRSGVAERHPRTTHPIVGHGCRPPAPPLAVNALPVEVLMGVLSFSVFAHDQVGGFGGTDAVEPLQDPFQFSGHTLGLLGVVELEFHFEVDVEALH